MSGYYGIDVEIFPIAMRDAYERAFTLWAGESPESRVRDGPIHCTLFYGRHGLLEK
jgi:hypothetical protein